MSTKNFRFHGKLIAVKSVAHDTSEFTFQVEETLSYEPGQYLWLVLSNLKSHDPRGERRAFSITNIQNKKNTVSILTRFGESPFKQALFSLGIGEKVEILAPFGNSYVVGEDTRKKIIMIAGGTGLASFLAPIEKLKNTKTNCQLILVNRLPERVPCLDRLKKIKKTYKTFHFTSKIGEFEWKDIQSPPQSNESEWWISGSQLFCDIVYKILDSEGIPLQNMKFEENYPTIKASLLPEQFDSEGGQAILKILINALANSTNHIVITDNNGRIIFANKSAQTITGFSFDEMVGNTPRLWGGLMDKKFYKVFWEKKKNGEDFTGEIINRRKNGEIYHSIAHVTPILNEKKQIIGHLATEQDITELRNIQEQLRVSDERWSFALEGSQNAVWDWDIQTNKVFFSHRLKEMLGYSEEEFKDDLSEWSNKIHPEDLHSVEEEVEKHMKGLTKFYYSEHRLLCKDGTYKWILDRGKIMSYDEKGKPVRMVGTHTDISDRKLAEEKLRDLSLIAQKTSNLVVITDKDGFTTWVNDAFIETTGYTLADMLGKKPGDVLQGEETDKAAIIAMHKGLKTKKAFSQEILNYTKNGKKYWLDINISPILDAKGNVIKFIAVQRNITSKKNTELELTNLANRLSLATESAQIGIWDYDIETGKRTWNDQMYKLYGADNKKSPEKVMRERLEKEEIEKLNKAILNLGKRKDQKHAVVLKVTPKNGEVRYIKTFGMAKKSASNKVEKIIGLTFDVTQEFLLDKAKTEFISLASHQLRTPLTNLKWKLKLMIDGDYGKFTDTQKERLNELYNTNQSLIDLVNALLNTSRVEMGILAMEPEVVDLKKLSKDILSNLVILAKNNKVKIVTDIATCPSKFKVDPVIYKILVENLVSNAIKYSKKQGSVQVTIGKMLSKKIIDKVQVDAGDILITVKDAGIGIPEKQKSKIFSKLFRATNAGIAKTSGNGLGLYLVKAMVNEFGGDIWFKSSLGRGTVFHIRIPKRGMEKVEGSKMLEENK